jgi:hypothetical protein
VTAVDADSFEESELYQGTWRGMHAVRAFVVEARCNARTLAIRDVCGLLLQADRRGSGLKVIEGGGLAANGVDDAPIAAAELPDLR